MRIRLLGKPPYALALVSEALSRLRHGAIQLTEHDGKVMQIDVTERKRLADCGSRDDPAGKDRSLRDRAQEPVLEPQGDA
jgi:hypothetical protein